MDKGDEQALRIKGNEIGDFAGTVVAEQPPVAGGMTIRRNQIRDVIAYVAKKRVVLAYLTRHEHLFFAFTCRGLLVSQFVGLPVGGRRK